MNSEEYLANVKGRILRGRAPHMESYFAMVLWGKPRDVVETSGELRIICEVPSAQASD